MSMRAPKIAWGGLPIRVGVIGGSGLYKLDGIEIIDVVNPETVRPVKRLVLYSPAMGLPIVPYFHWSYSHRHSRCLSRTTWNAALHLAFARPVNS